MLRQRHKYLPNSSTLILIFVLFSFTFHSPPSSSLFVQAGVYDSARRITTATTTSTTTATSSTRLSSIRYSNNNPAKYDRSITTFSNDGRLLQVEYAMEASEKGQTVACLELEYRDLSGKWRVSAVCVGLVVQEEDEGVNFEPNSTEEKEEEIKLEEDGNNGDSSSSSKQDSTTNPPQSTSTTMITSEKIYRIDDHCLFIPTGLIGDARLLATNARLSCQRLRLTNGESPTMNEISQLVSGIQHQLTRTAGARPLGVSAIFVGVDPYPEDDDFNVGLLLVSDNEEEEDEEKEEEEEGEVMKKGFVEDEIEEEPVVWGKPRLFQSEPGGILEEYEACAAGKARRILEPKLVELRKTLLKRANALVQQYRDDHDAKYNNENDDEEEEDDIDTHIPQNIKTQILQEMVHGVGKLLFDEKKDTKAQTIDLWLVESDLECRGGARIQCAKHVLCTDVESVCKRFANAKS